MRIARERQRESVGEHSWRLALARCNWALVLLFLVTGFTICWLYGRVGKSVGGADGDCGDGRAVGVLHEWRAQPRPPRVDPGAARQRGEMRSSSRSRSRGRSPRMPPSRTSRIEWCRSRPLAPLTGRSLGSSGSVRGSGYSTSTTTRCRQPELIERLPEIVARRGHHARMDCAPLALPDYRHVPRGGALEHGVPAAALPRRRAVRAVLRRLPSTRRGSRSRAVHRRPVVASRHGNKPGRKATGQSVCLRDRPSRDEDRRTCTQPCALYSGARAGRGRSSRAPCGALRDRCCDRGRAGADESEEGLSHSHGRGATSTGPGPGLHTPIRCTAAASRSRPCRAR